MLESTAALAYPELGDEIEQTPPEAQQLHGNNTLLLNLSPKILQKTHVFSVNMWREGGGLSDGREGSVRWRWDSSGTGLGPGDPEGLIVVKGVI
jgi:hypothetical protein